MSEPAGETQVLAEKLERARSDPLSSPALGTASSDLIEPCAVREPEPAVPPPRAELGLALAFSGGGFRASLAALGVLRFVADAGLLERVRYVSSVSGGSVAHGLFARHYLELEQEQFSAEALDRIVIEPFIERISGHSLIWKLVRNAWRMIGPRTRTHLLAQSFDEWFYGGRQLEELSPRCRFVFNAANLTTGVRFGFERDVFGDYVLGRRVTAGSGLRLADAVAASAAFPGAFAPLVLRDFEFPCAEGRVAKLLDGGAYDNMGLEAVDDLPETFLVALNAGGLFHTGRIGKVPFIRNLTRVNSLLYRQSTALRRREMVSRFQAFEKARAAGQPPPEWGRQGVLFGLATTFDEPSPKWIEGRPEHEEVRLKLALVKTTFARFRRELCRQLVYRGWWLAGCSVATFHPDLVAELPHWRPLVGET
ncbi:MAG: patatin-like phospholipase family protein [Actinomycetota bacterium]